ncbi:MAG: DUF115 domain-containing protein [Humidesulfovibrio sp.]|nr:DUF115 domain-containing protein [Humidesulfovibrio sp.]
MAHPLFLAVVDDIPPLAEELVVCLGRPKSIPQLHKDRLLVLYRVDEAALGRIAALNPRRMAKGVVVVASREEHARDPRMMLRAQKMLAYLFVKYVDLPMVSTRIPDPARLRPADTPPEFPHMLNMFRNTPLHLQHCLADKLRDKAVGMPCLLLLPGPSLELVRDHLPELARRYLIVTISRVLPFLRACGVVPDVLVQLDTVPLQEHFHHQGDLFPNTVLLALSLAPVRSFAPRFRRIFFIDSFNLSMLPNPARVRESWLSSMLACLGVAEALHAPEVLLAGVDLRVIGENVYASQQKDHDLAPHYTEPMVTLSSGLATADMNGRLAHTSLHYFAMAAEAEMFAREIHAAQGTLFHNLSPWSLLDPEVCAPMSLEQAKASPVLDKTVFLDKADQAAAMQEHIHLEALCAGYADALEDARHSRDIMACLRCTDREALPMHPYHRYVAANLPWFRPAGKESLGRLAENLASELCAATRFARNVAALHCQAARGVAVPVLCDAQEEPETLARLGRLRPGWSWRCMGIHAPTSEGAAPSSGTVALAALHDWMRSQEVLVISPACAREFHYALSLIAGDNVLDLEELLAYTPLC